MGRRRRAAPQGPRPQAERHRPKWQLALELLDELAAWDLVPPAVLADAAYGEVSEFRLGLEQRGLVYVVQVPGTLSAYPEDVAPELAASTGRGGHRCPAAASAAHRSSSWWRPPVGRPPPR